MLMKSIPLTTLVQSLMKKTVKAGSFLAVICADTDAHASSFT